MLRKFLLFFLLFSSGHAEEEEEKPFCLLRNRNVGMFSVFEDVLILCDGYEQGIYSGIQVDFGNQGFFYQENHGENWWNYYCQPICHGTPSSYQVSIGTPERQRCYKGLTRRKAHEIITKYIHVLPYIEEEVDHFINTHFKDHFILSVHYRGADKHTEAPRVSYSVVIDTIKQFIEENPLKKIKIFLATDEEPFCELMQQTFTPEQLCFNPHVVRTSARAVHGIHYRGEERYENGKNALIDCLLLSRGDFLIRTSSNLSQWASFFSPNLPVLELNHTYWGMRHHVHIK